MTTGFAAVHCWCYARADVQSDVYGLAVGLITASCGWVHLERC